MYSFKYERKYFLLQMLNNGGIRARKGRGAATEI
jgi:hypothetical protein